MKTQFRRWHPFCQFLYFAEVIGISMFVRQPVFLILSFLGGLCMAFCISRDKLWKRIRCIYLPMVVLSMVVNPLFSHEGMTILTYFPDGNPLTAESVFYGLFMGVMLGAVLLWFFSFQEEMTWDRLQCVTGIFLPAVALMMSMVFRFIPEFRRQAGRMMEARTSLKTGGPGRGRFRLLSRGIQVFSGLVTWSFEHSIQRSDSMRARGYGLPRRSRYRIFVWGAADTVHTVVLAGLGMVLWFCQRYGDSGYQYYPWFRVSMGGVGTAACAVFFLLCLYPVISCSLEERRWNYLQSKI